MFVIRAFWKTRYRAMIMLFWAALTDKIAPDFFTLILSRKKGKGQAVELLPKFMNICNFFSLNTQEVQFVCGLYVDLHRLSLGHALYVNKYFQLKLKEPIFHIKRKHVRVWNTYFAKEYMKDLNAFFLGQEIASY